MRGLKHAARVLVVIAAFTFLTGAAASDTSGWNPQTFFGNQVFLHAVSFADADHGWTVGDNGTIVGTNDGGTNWSAQDSGTTQALFGVSFVDADHGWAVGGGGTIVATSDGGATWNTESCSPCGNDELRSVSFVDQTHGWAVDTAGKIFGTSDGGATWSAETSGTTNELFGVSFVDQDHGVAVGDNGTIVATDDGGATWITEPSGTSNGLRGVSFVDADHGWVVGGNGTILATQNEGSTWTTQTTNTIQSLLESVSFVDADHGWAVGGSDVIVATSNGGQTWNQEISGLSGGFLDGVSFNDQDHGWAVGDRNTILATSNGGITPAQVGTSASSLSFGSKFVGSTSSAQTVTITNTAASGAEPLALGQLTTGGANPGDFTLSNDTCSNASVAAGSTCTVDISFSPTAIGSRNGSLTIPSNAASSPDTVSLSGSGSALADVSLNLSGPSSVKRGAQATYVITVANAGPTGAHNVVLSDPLPAGMSFVGVSTTRGTCTHPSAGGTKGTITCSLGDLAGGANTGAVVSLKVAAKVGGTVTNLVSAYSTANGGGSATPDPNTNNNWAAVTSGVTK
jgi:uncharacterized repeat protein (TIGR01451 family)